MKFPEIKIDIAPSVPQLPSIKDKTKVDVRYTLISPYVSIHIYWDSANNELVYEVEEPILNDMQKDALEKIETAMIELMNINIVVDKTQEAMTAYISNTASLIVG